jgi:hypothetical protein
MPFVCKGTGLVVIFLTVFWTVLLALPKYERRWLVLTAARLPLQRDASARYPQNSR